MVDATISRVRLRDLARLGRSGPDAPACAPQSAISWHHPSSRVRPGPSCADGEAVRGPLPTDPCKCGTIECEFDRHSALRNDSSRATVDVHGAQQSGLLVKKRELGELFAHHGTCAAAFPEFTPILRKTHRPRAPIEATGLRRRSRFSDRIEKNELALWGRHLLAVEARVIAFELNKCAMSADANDLCDLRRRSMVRRRGLRRTRTLLPGRHSADSARVGVCACAFRPVNPREVAGGCLGFRARPILRRALPARRRRRRRRWSRASAAGASRSSPW